MATISAAAADGNYYRSDGVRITHDPSAPEMAAKYGRPGGTDRDGFDPYADSVGAGIYGGTVERGADGSVTIGRQYQDHNPEPGPIYSGGGYTPVSLAIGAYRSERQAELSGAGGETTLARLLDLHPDLVNDVSTGGALPLHTCGMSQENQHATAFLISRGGDIEAQDTYGYTPMHRMASNNLAVGAKALLDVGADPATTGDGTTPPPRRVAQQSRAQKVIEVLEEHGPRRLAVPVTAVQIISASYEPLIGRYLVRESQDIPRSFAMVCEQAKWPVEGTWKKLNGGEGGRWFGHTENDSYIYYNQGDGLWWIDGPDGLGRWVAPGSSSSPPASALAWKEVESGGSERAGAPPTIAVYRAVDGDGQ